MDTIETYRRIIQRVFHEYANLPYAHGDIQKTVIFDPEADTYLLMASGWDGAKRIHGCIIHIDLIDGKLWIQRDSTEHGIADDLVAYGVPKDRIVLGFRAPDLRKYTDYAAA